MILYVPISLPHTNFIFPQIGPLADRWRVVRNHFKASLIVLLVLCLACFVWFTLRYAHTVSTPQTVPC